MEKPWYNVPKADRPAVAIKGTPVELATVWALMIGLIIAVGLPCCSSPLWRPMASSRPWPGMIPRTKAR